MYAKGEEERARSRACADVLLIFASRKFLLGRNSNEFAVSDE